jgi:amino acid transporter
MIVVKVQVVINYVLTCFSTILVVVIFITIPNFTTFLVELSSLSFIFLVLISFATTLCQRREEPQEQRLIEKSMTNFQTRNKTRLCVQKQKHRN